jgi:hypothetical protein
VSSRVARSADISAKISDRLPEVLKFGEHLKKEFKTVSILGYCWGEC